MKTVAQSLLALVALLPACSSTKSSAPEMTEAEQMAAWQKYMTPGEAHRRLDPLVGRWQATVKSRMAADAPWAEDKGTCDNRWTLDGHFVETIFHGSFLGQPYEGRGLNGYDNSTGQYVGFWTDNFSTGLAPISTGSVDASGKVFTYVREMRDPISGRPCRMRDVTRITSPTSHSMESYCQMGDDPEYLMMTIEFTR